MKSIFSIVILSLFSVSVLANPKSKNDSRIPTSVLDSDKRFWCKNGKSNFVYVVNVTDGEVDVFVNDHKQANGIPTKLTTKDKLIEGLHVKTKHEVVEGSRKKITSYVLSQKFPSNLKGEILRPLLEIELESNDESSQVSNADMTIMGDMPYGFVDIEENISCKGSKKN